MSAPNHARVIAMDADRRAQLAGDLLAVLENFGCSVTRVSDDLGVEIDLVKRLLSAARLRRRLGRAA